MSKRTLGKIIEAGQVDGIYQHLFVDANVRTYEFMAYNPNNKSLVLGYVDRKGGLRVVTNLLAEHFEDPEIGVSAYAQTSPKGTDEFIFGEIEREEAQEARL